MNGTSYARLTGLTYEQCEARCLGDPQCVALEHFRGGGVIFGRTAQCKLFSSAGEPRASTLADSGYKRPGAAPKRVTAPVTAESKAQDVAREKALRETARREEQKTAAQPPPAPPSSPGPIAGGAPPPPPSATKQSPQPVPPVATAPVTKPPSEPPRPRSILKPIETGPGGAAQADWHVVPVYYGTDRNRRDIAGKRIAYGSDRARRVEMGRALITIPKEHQVPKVERPWRVTIPFTDIAVYEEQEDPKKHFTIKELSVLSKAEMVALIRERLGASNAYRNQALVLIHGYNNGFDDALYRSAQISYDLNFDGASFLYSWPSGSGIAKYLYDRDSAEQAEPHLTQFLQMILDETGAEKVNIIAHSMGNHLLLPVLRYIKDRNPAMAVKINQIILAAPDVDRDRFYQLAADIRGVGRGITMYASSNDIALQVSRRFAGDQPRAGDVPAGLGPAVVPGIDTIDVSGLSTDYLAINHSSYAEKTALLRDIELVLKTGERPPERRFPIFQRVPGPNGDYWRYPN